MVSHGRRGQRMIMSKLNSTIHPDVWGGRKLAEKYGKGNGLLTRIAESLESCDTLDRLGLCLKWIDTDFPTSVQVHPQGENPDKLSYIGEEGNEIWIIVESEPESRIGIGFIREVSQAEVLEAANHLTLERLLNTIHPNSGDCFVIPHGTVHYIGGGITALEWKSRRGRTLRLYDWGRNRMTGRTIQMAESLSIARVRATFPQRIPLPLETGPVSATPLWDNRTMYFGRHKVDGQVTFSGHGEKFITCLEGIFSMDGDVLHQGETIHFSGEPEESFPVLQGNGILFETILREQEA